MSTEFEHLKTAYYDDFFFQHVEVINQENNCSILASDFQGKFLQLIWDALIEFSMEEKNMTSVIKKFGKNSPYTLSKTKNILTISESNQQNISIDLHVFFEAYYEATKRYLNFIKKENPRVVYQENFQQLSASCYYYETHHNTKLVQADL